MLNNYKGLAFVSPFLYICKKINIMVEELLLETEKSLSNLIGALELKYGNMKEKAATMEERRLVKSAIANLTSMRKSYFLDKETNPISIASAIADKY